MLVDHLLNIVKGFENVEKANLKHLYRNELDKAYFAHDAAYSESKDLAKRTISVKILKNRTYEIAINCGYDGYQRVSVSISYKFFDKKTGSGITANELKNYINQ